MSLPRITFGQHVAESGAVYDRVEMKDLVRLVAHAAGLDAEGIASIAVPKGASYALIFKPKMPKAHKPAVSQGPAGPAVSVKPKHEEAAAPAAPPAPPAATPDLAAVLANPAVLALLQSLGGLAGLAPVAAPAANPEPAHKPLSLGQPVKGKGKRAA